jgi:NTE family protein
MTAKVGIALGSGASRGWTHIGVLKALNKLGIYPDVVAGCSAGASVGLAYASGKLEEYEEWVRQLSWREIMSLVDFSFTGGFIKGERLIDFFRGDDDVPLIEKLPIKFGAVTTEMYSGREVWITEGSGLFAVRASCAFPGLFQPAKGEQGWLIDGGLVNPVPVSLCRALGAEIIIGVNLNAELVKVNHFSEKVPEVGEAPPTEEEDSFIGRFFSSNGNAEEPEKTPAMMDVLSSSIGIMQDRITRSRMAGDPPEVMLIPRLGDFGILEFQRAAEAIDEGERVVMAASESLQRLGIHNGPAQVNI